MTFKSLPFAPRKIRATEERLERIYEAASLGLKGDALALASGLLPTEYRQLCELDPVASLAEMKGRADSEREAAAQLRDAARNGDAKAALSILQHTHGWVAKQAISVDVEQRISITAALEQAQKRVINKVIDALDVTDLSDLNDLTPDNETAKCKRPSTQRTMSKSLWRGCGRPLLRTTPWRLLCMCSRGAKKVRR
jgi:hypothetical protein